MTQPQDIMEKAHLILEAVLSLESDDAQLHVIAGALVEQASYADGKHEALLKKIETLKQEVEHCNHRAVTWRALARGYRNSGKETAPE